MEHVRINATADADNTVIAAPGTGRRIVVVNYSVDTGGAVGTVTFRSGAAGTIHATFSTAAATKTFSFSGTRESPAFRCDANAAFVINNPVSNDTIGHVSYVVQD